MHLAIRKSIQIPKSHGAFLPPFLEGNWDYNPTEIHQSFPWHTVQDSAMRAAGASPFHRGLGHLPCFSVCSAANTWFTWLINCFLLEYCRATRHSCCDTFPIWDSAPPGSVSLKIFLQLFIPTQELETVSCLVRCSASQVTCPGNSPLHQDTEHACPTYLKYSRVAAAQCCTAQFPWTRTFHP